MTENAIRVQLPGGSIYAPALHEAAAKTGARSGLPKRSATALAKLVDASVAMLNSGDPSMITLEIHVHEDSFLATVSGKGCTSPTKKLVTDLKKLAAKRAREFTSTSTKTATTVRFEI